SSKGLWLRFPRLYRWEFRVNPTPNGKAPVVEIVVVSFVPPLFFLKTSRCPQSSAVQTEFTSAFTASLIARSFSSKPAGPPDESTKFSTNGGAGRRVIRFTLIGGGGGKRAASKATAVIAFCRRPENAFIPFTPSVKSLLRGSPEKNVPFGTGRMLL